MLARRLPTILSPLEADEALEVTRIRLPAGHAPRRVWRAAAVSRATSHGFDRGPRRRRLDPASPRRSTLAHRGVLFLDELGEFTARTRRVAPAHRGARGADLTSGDGGRVPCRLPPHRVLEPVPLRAGRSSCECTERNAPATAAASRRRSSTVSTCASRSTHPSRATGPVSRRPRCVQRVAEAVARQQRRYARRQWRRNSQVPAGALAQVIPLSKDADDALAVGDWPLGRTTGPGRRPGAARPPAPSPTSKEPPRCANATLPLPRSVRTCRERRPTAVGGRRGRGGHTRLSPHGPEPAARRARPVARPGGRGWPPSVLARRATPSRAMRSADSYPRARDPGA